MAELQVRRMVAADLPAGHALTQAVGWSHRLEDWQFHFALGKGWVAVDAAGTVLGTIMWWPWGEQAATLGLVVVSPKAQGRGIGKLLLQVALKDAGPRAVRLMATSVALKLYQQNGFNVLGSLEQRQAVPKAVAAPSLPAGVELRSIGADDLPSLVRLDTLATGVPRPALVAAVLNEGNGRMVWRAGMPVGFALVRRSGRGQLIGPLVAEDESQAIALVAALLQSCTGIVRIDVPTTATRLHEWLDAAGLATVDRVTPMVRGTWPVVGASVANGTDSAGPAGITVHRYGLASQALG